MKTMPTLAPAVIFTSQHRDAAKEVATAVSKIVVEGCHTVGSRKGVPLRTLVCGFRGDLFYIMEITRRDVFRDGATMRRLLTVAA